MVHINVRKSSLYDVVEQMWQSILKISLKCIISIYALYLEHILNLSLFSSLILGTALFLFIGFVLVSWLD